jgi:tetratricopeptide (TPR) repeat protein
MITERWAEPTLAVAAIQSAVQDFTQAIAIGCTELCGSYENRADAYIKLQNYPKAIEDISGAIRLKLSYAVFQMNIDQFRRLYPEYDAVSDDVLCEKVRALFYPEMQYADFAKQFLIEAKEFDSTVLPDLYLKRGDTYTTMKEVRKANLEYDRVERAFPKAAAYSSVEVKGKRVRQQQ